MQTLPHRLRSWRHSLDTSQPLLAWLCISVCGAGSHSQLDAAAFMVISSAAQPVALSSLWTLLKQSLPLITSQHRQTWLYINSLDFLGCRACMLKGGAFFHCPLKLLFSMKSWQWLASAKDQYPLFSPLFPLQFSLPTWHGPPSHSCCGMGQAAQTNTTLTVKVSPAQSRHGASVRSNRSATEIPQRDQSSTEPHKVLQKISDRGSPLGLRFSLLLKGSSHCHTI